MTYIDYMNQLWRSALVSPMPASEIALYAYLVNESNKRYWKMPFLCSTTRICEELRISRQTVITARKHLAGRKLIAFSEGKSRHLPSKYSILEWTDDLTVGPTDNLTLGLTHLKDKEKDSFIGKANENFENKNRKDYGISKRKENRRLCPIPEEGTDYDGAF